MATLWIQKDKLPVIWDLCVVEMMLKYANESLSLKLKGMHVAHEKFCSEPNGVKIIPKEEIGLDGNWNVPAEMSHRCGRQKNDLQRCPHPEARTSRICDYVAKEIRVADGINVQQLSSREKNGL